MTITDLNDFVRFFLSLSCDAMSDDDLNLIIESVLSSGIAESDCQEKYYAVKATLEYLIRKNSISTGTGDGSGKVRIREEVIGRRRVKVEYSDKKDTVSDLESVLADLLADPTILLCDPFPTNPDSKGSGGVIIGVNKKKYVQNETPWRRNLDRTCWGYGLNSRSRY